MPVGKTLLQRPKVRFELDLFHHQFSQRQSQLRRVRRLYRPQDVQLLLQLSQCKPIRLDLGVLLGKFCQQRFEFRRVARLGQVLSRAADSEKAADERAAWLSMAGADAFPLGAAWAEAIATPAKIIIEKTTRSFI